MNKMSGKTKEMPELLTLKEACELLKCHPNTLREWDRKGVLKAVRFGVRKDRRYRREDLLRFVEQKNSEQEGGV